MQIISYSRFEESVKYFREFQEIGRSRYTGFSFECDKDGKLLKDYPSFAYCLANPDKYVDEGVRKLVNSYRVPMKIRCACNRVLDLDGDTDCECGRWYNSSGQELNPPHMWGEETGERFDRRGNPIL